MKLVVIEGIGKLETVQKYLGAGYKVFATGGHVRDLPKNRLAVNIKNNYAPSYTVVDDKKETVERLRAAAKSAETVLLATDRIARARLYPGTSRRSSIYPRTLPSG